jgi:hypothetical protein
MAKVVFSQHHISRASKSLQILSRSIVEHGITFHLRLEALKLVIYCVRNSSSCRIDDNTRTGEVHSKRQLRAYYPPGTSIKRATKFFPGQNILDLVFTSVLSRGDIEIWGGLAGSM